MDKVKFSEWFTARIISSTDELRDKVEGSSTHPLQKKVAALLASLGTRPDETRLEAIKEFAVGTDMAESMETLTIDDFIKSIETVPFAIMCMTGSSGGHNYGGNYFLAMRSASGYRSDGSMGNNFPGFASGLWKVASPEKAAEMAAKYLALVLESSTEFSEYIRAIRVYAEPLVDFSELD